MSLAADVSGLERALLAHQREVSRIDARLDPYENPQIRQSRRADAVAALVAGNAKKLGDWCESIFGYPDDDDPRPATFLDDWDDALDRLRKAKARALDGIDFARLASEATRLRASLDLYISADEVLRWYDTEADDAERLALQYHPETLDRFEAGAPVRTLRRQLATDFAKRHDTPAVRKAEDAVQEVQRLRIRAWQLLGIVQDVLGADGPHYTDSRVVKMRRRYDARMKVDSASMDVEWTFTLRPRTEGVFMPSMIEGME